MKVSLIAALVLVLVLGALYAVTNSHNASSNFDETAVPSATDVSPADAPPPVGNKNFNL